MDAQDLLLLTVSTCDKQTACQVIIHPLSPPKKHDPINIKEPESTL